MARRTQDVTDAELEVLRALWELGPRRPSAPSRTVSTRAASASEYATVQKLLERLEDKGHVSHQRLGPAERLRGARGPRGARRQAPARHRRAAVRGLADAAADAPGEHGAALARGAARAAAAGRPPVAGALSVAPLLQLVLTNAAVAGLLALLAWTASRLSRRQALVHGLWLLAIVKLLTPPVLPLRVLPAWDDLPRDGLRRSWSTIPPSVHRGPAAAAAPGWARSPAQRRPVGPPATTPRPASLSRSSRPSPVSCHGASPFTPRRAGFLASRLSLVLSVAGWTVALETLLTIGALAVLALTVSRFLRFRRLLSGADPADERLARRTLELGRRLGLRRMPTLWLVREPLPPLVWPAAGGPKLVLPAGTARRSSRSTSSTRCWPTSSPTSDAAITGFASSRWRPRRSSGGTRSPGGRAARCAVPRSAAVTSGCCASCRRRRRPTRGAC